MIPFNNLLQKLVINHSGFPLRNTVLHFDPTQNAFLASITHKLFHCTKILVIGLH